MTATCPETCCGGQRRRSVSELFERGFRRNRAAPLEHEGVACADLDGNVARFSVGVRDGRLANVGFRASTCATLIAYCELVATLAAEQPLRQAQALRAADLVGGLDGVPLFKRARAPLAIAAFRAALAAVPSTPAEPRGTTDESRLHLRHPAP